MPDNLSAEAAAATLKLPPFWSQDPELWFTQIEAQFAVKGITQDQTKFDHLVSSLQPETATEVRDVLISPPNTQKYKALKKAIVERTTVSTKKRLQQLLTSEQLGDRTPSQLLRRMRQLTGNKVDVVSNELLKTLWVQRLPPSVQAVIATRLSTEDSLETLASTADLIMEVVPSMTIMAASSVKKPTDEMESLKMELAELKKKFSSFRSDGRRPKDSRSPGTKSVFKGRSPTPPRKKSDDDTICWFHRKFGRDAKNCRAPCSYPGNERSSQ